MLHHEIFQKIVEENSHRLTDRFELDFEPDHSKVVGNIRNTLSELYNSREDIHKTQLELYSNSDHQLSKLLEFKESIERSEHLLIDLMTNGIFSNYKHLSAKIIDSSNRIDNLISDKSQKVDRLIHHHQDSLDNLIHQYKLGDQNERLLESISWRRQQISKNIEDKTILNGIVKERNIHTELDLDHIENVGKALRENEEINKINNSLYSLFNRYKEDIKNRSQEQKVSSLDKNYLIDISRIEKLIENYNYLEASNEVKKLKREIKQFNKNPRDFIDKFNSTLEEKSNLKSIRSYLNDLDQSEINSEKILIIRRIRSLFSFFKKEDHIKKNKLIFLEDEINEYNSVVEEISSSEIIKKTYDSETLFLDDKLVSIDNIFKLSDKELKTSELVDQYNVLKKEVKCFLKEQYKGTREQINYLNQNQEKINNLIEESNEINNYMLKNKFKGLNSLIDIYSQRSFFDFSKEQKDKRKDNKKDSEKEEQEPLIRESYKVEPRQMDINSTEKPNINITSINELISFSVQAFQDCNNPTLKEVCSEIGVTKGRGYIPPLEKRINEINRKLSKIDIQQLEEYEIITYNSIEKSLSYLF